MCASGLKKKTNPHLNKDSRVKPWEEEAGFNQVEEVGSSKAFLCGHLDMQLCIWI
jgi:hypothetical protein